MIDNTQQNKPEQKNTAQAPKKPNELGAIHVEGFIKIHDPNSKEVYLESRA